MPLAPVHVMCAATGAQLRSGGHRRFARRICQPAEEPAGPFASPSLLFPVLQSDSQQALARARRRSAPLRQPLLRCTQPGSRSSVLCAKAGSEDGLSFRRITVWRTTQAPTREEPRRASWCCRATKFEPTASRMKRTSALSYTIGSDAASTSTQTLRTSTSSGYQS